MRSADQFTSAPKNYNVVVPDGWFQVSLDPDDRDRSIVALAELTFRGVDNAPHIKQEFMRDLQRKAKDAYRVGGTELYLSTLTVGPVPLASSLLISVPGPEEWPQTSDADELAEHLLGQNTGGDREVGVVELAVAGKSVRYRCREAADPDRQMGNTLPSTTLTYYVPIPTTVRWLLLNFSTPVDPLADQMVELFDAVAGTLHWE
ncbi:hypothetical protein [Streptomyces griseorubiginosus]|uniref:hypothetical protein n=1 Tax=Streptomyces griseorubiginosus TaxID=67304 RepID=UPI001AD6FFEB|nr:hypothetical protein [Streptomyces griseorubiginosus]MBO4258017.1 hypothetical protein [Streptomyces griseorubiginosus]